jgi:CheY-like chemotaxis protein
MGNNMSTIDDVQRHLIPKIAPCCKEEHIRELVQSLESMMRDNKSGHEKCKDALILKQISAGDYQPVLEALHVRSFCDTKWSSIAHLSIDVDPAVPKWLLASAALLNIILENAIHNAIEHGERSGQITMSLSVLDSESLLIAIKNGAGRNHAAALRMQSDHGDDALMSNREGLDLGGIGSAQSTFLGMGEMREAAAVMGASLSLVFYPQSGMTPPHTLFSLKIGLKPTSAPVIPADEGEVPPLREGTVMLCIDDDHAPRIGYKGLIKKLKVKESAILGRTHAEAFCFVETVLTAAEAHGDLNVVCILDQNMEYKEGVIRGTEVVAALRREGFKGVVLIRSANDDNASGLVYRAAGANGYLSKSAPVKELALDVVRQCEFAWSMES